VPDETLWPPPGGRHRASGMTGPTRRYALIVLALAVASSLPILAAIGPGAGSVGSALAVGEPLDTTPFIAPPSPGPVVVIPIRPSLAEPPPRPPLATLSAPAETSPRRPQRRVTTKPHRHVATHGAPERVRVRPRVRVSQPPRVRQPAARVEPARAARKPPRVVHRRKLWRHPPATLLHPCRHPHRHQRRGRS
jgi:hypothetical protein